MLSSLFEGGAYGLCRQLEVAFECPSYVEQLRRRMMSYMRKYRNSEPDEQGNYRQYTNSFLYRHQPVPS